MGIRVSSWRLWNTVLSVKESYLSRVPTLTDVHRCCTDTPLQLAFASALAAAAAAAQDAGHVVVVVVSAAAAQAAFDFVPLVGSVEHQALCAADPPAVDALAPTAPAEQVAIHDASSTRCIGQCLAQQPTTRW